MNRELQRAIKEFHRAKNILIAAESNYNFNALTHPRNKVCLLLECVECWRLFRPSLLWDRQCPECSTALKTYTVVAQCDVCGKYKKYSPTGVYKRSHLGNLDQSGYIDARKFCVGCWNRYRPSWDAAASVMETTRILNKLKREITYANARDKSTKT